MPVAVCKGECVLAQLVWVILLYFHFFKLLIILANAILAELLAAFEIDVNPPLVVHRG